MDEAARPAYLDRYKLGRPVLSPTHNAGDFDSHEVDCPCVVALPHGGFAMAYAGWDGTANRIGIAFSEDLLNWRQRRLLLDCGPEGAWDAGSVSGPFLLRDGDTWLLAYCGFPYQGYEAGPGAIGMARSSDLSHWEREPANPVFRPSADPLAWDAGGIYKPFLLPRGDEWWLYYNAKNAPPAAEPWHEQIGLAVSEDLVHFVRRGALPIVPNGPPSAWDSQFCADPWLVWIGDSWHLFYYGFDGVHAQEGVALSADGLTFEKAPWNPIIRSGLPGELDSVHAHKPCVIEHEGAWYHFYCCVGHERAITVARSTPWA